MKLSQAMKVSGVAAGSILGLVLAGAPVTSAVAAPAQHAVHSGYSATTYSKSLTPEPRSGGCDIQWAGSGSGYYYAGYSNAWNTVVGYGSTGNQVKEIQCLVGYFAADPGPVDGIYGANTQQAVVKAQQICGISEDGVVGPQTWRCIREPRFWN